MHLYLGQASNYHAKDVFRHLFTFGTKKSAKSLISTLAEHYHTTPSHVFLTANGRSAITLALESFKLKKHSEVLINGFTCFAVLQAVKAAGLTPVYADITRDTLNFSAATLESILRTHDIRVLILQNTLGLSEDYKEIVKIAKQHNIFVIEDLAHCAGLRYASGVEMGTVGDAACLSFGKGKSIDTITGGALILAPSVPDENLPKSPSEHHLSDSLRARWYPVFGAIGRFFSKIHLEKYWYGPLIRLGFIRRAVDERLDTSVRPAYWQCALAERQIRAFSRNTRPIRTHLFVKNRPALLDELEKNGFHFREVWYDVPVSPVRYYKTLDFPEADCPVATRVSEEIINIPTYYDKNTLKPALKIIKNYELEEK